MKKTIFNSGTPVKGIIAGVFVLSSFMALAQEPATCRKSLWGGFGYFALSGEQINIGELNTSLAANGYGQFNSNVVSLGGGGGFMTHKVFIGGGGAWLLGSANKNGGNSAGLRGGYGQFNVGYVVWSGKRSLLYPCLGIGGGGYDITVTKANVTSDFNQQLNAPAGMTTVQSGGLILSGQLSYQFFFNKEALQGFCLGIKAGYKFSPASWKTSINDTELSNAPNINMNGLFVTIYLGGGSLLNN